jgi:hypothetical protein
MDSAAETTTKVVTHLASLPGGVGCRHLARQRDEFDATILVSLSLVKPIMSRVPRCEEHGCPLVAECEHVGDFEPGSSGNKAGVKYRPTPDGMAATTNPNIVTSATMALPAVSDVLTILEAGPMTVFELNTHLRNAWSHPGQPPNRPELGAVVQILVQLGRLRVDAGASLVRLRRTN